MSERPLLQGKTALVTGSTTGIGHQIAVDLAARGAHVIVTGRADAAVAAAVEQSRRSTGNERVTGKSAELSVRDGRRTLAAAVLEAHDRLDVLVNNAGALFTEHRLTADGVERTLALNHVAAFELTHLLLPALKAANAARVITVSSQLHARGTIHFDDLSLSGRYAPLRAYAQSKLANVLFTRELARRLSGTRVTANCFHPGMVRSRFGKTNDGVVGRLTGLGLSIAQALFGIGVVSGADTGVFLATATELEGQSGGYFYKRAAIEPSAAARDDLAASRLWQVTEGLLDAARAA